MWPQTDLPVEDSEDEILGVDLHGVVVVAIGDVIGADEEVALVSRPRVGQPQLDQELAVGVNIPLT